MPQHNTHLRCIMVHCLPRSIHNAPVPGHEVQQILLVNLQIKHLGCRRDWPVTRCFSAISNNSNCSCSSSLKSWCCHRRATQINRAATGHRNLQLLLACACITALTEEHSARHPQRRAGICCLNGGVQHCMPLLAAEASHGHIPTAQGLLAAGPDTKQYPGRQRQRLQEQPDTRVATALSATLSSLGTIRCCRHVASHQIHQTIQLQWASSQTTTAALLHPPN